MVLTRTELIESFQDEVRILLHLATKIDRTKLDYRPTPKQRSTIELLQYLAMMGPALVRAAQAGKFDGAAWGKEEEAAQASDFDQALAAVAAQNDIYAALIGGMSDADFRVEIEMFGMKLTRGAFLVTQALCACAAYRTQMFLYLKACGREELGTMNLWAGMDAPAS